MRVRKSLLPCPSYSYTTTWLPNSNMRALTEAENSGWAKSLTNTQKPSKSRTYLAFFEFASDLFDETSFGTWNPFEHYKQEVTPNPSGLMVQTCNGANFGQSAFGRFYLGKIPVDSVGIPAAYGTLSDPSNGSNGMYYEDTTGFHVSEYSGIPTLCNAALRQMLPGIRPKLLSFAEVYQTKDLLSVKSTLKRANEVRKFVSEMERRLPKIIRRRGYLKGNDDVARWLAALPADVFLQWKFNIEPLLGDIAAVKAALSDSSTQAAKLLKDEGKLLIRHYSAPLSSGYRDLKETNNQFVGEDQTIVGGDQFGDGTLGASINVSSTTRSISFNDPKFHAQIQYFYNYDDAQKKNFGAKALADSLGIGVNPLKDLWELTRWSFAIDWLVDVSHFLDNLEWTQTKPVTHITKWCWSQRVEREITVTAKGGNNNGLPPDSLTVFDATLVHSTATSYKRGTTYCNLVAALEGSGINSQEFVLALSLGLSRKKKV